MQSPITPTDRKITKPFCKGENRSQVRGKKKKKRVHLLEKDIDHQDILDFFLL